MADRGGEQTSPANDAVMKGISDLQRRLRVLEERYTTLRRKGQLIDENFLDTERDLRNKVKKLDEEHTEVRRMLIDLDDKLDRFLEQAKKAASREDVLILKKYVQMWDPIRYLTRDEALRLLEREKKRLAEQPPTKKESVKKTPAKKKTVAKKPTKKQATKKPAKKKPTKKTAHDKMQELLAQQAELEKKISKHKASVDK